jgi:hypothetical protein
VVGEAGVLEPFGGGHDVGRGGHLDPDVVQRAVCVGVVEEDQLERGVGDGEVGVAGPLLGRLDTEEVGVEAGGGVDVGDVEGELDAAGHRGGSFCGSPPSGSSALMTTEGADGRTAAAGGRGCVHRAVRSSVRWDASGGTDARREHR